MSVARPRGRSLAAAVLFGLIVLLTADRSAAQPAPKKALTHADYDNWNKESGVMLSPNGEYVAYSLMPSSGSGDGAVIVRQVASGKDIRIPRGASGGGLAGAVASVTGGPQFNPNSTKVIFPLPPTKAEIDKAKAAKAKPEDLPRVILAVMDLPSGKITARLPYEKSFRVGGKGTGFLIYHKRPKVETKDEAPARGSKGKRPPIGKRGGTTKAPPPRETPVYGSKLIIRNLATGRERSVNDVTEYSLTDEGRMLAYAVDSKKEQSNGVYVTDPLSPSPGVAVKSGPGRYTRLVWDRKDEQLAFFYDGRPDPANPRIAPPPRPKGWQLPVSPPAWRAYVWDRGADLTGAVTGAETEVRAAAMAPAAEVVGPDATGLREGWTISGGSLRFSDDGKRLFVSTTPRRETARPASVPADQGVELDIWHWKDNYIQPMQRVRGNTDRNRTYSGVVFLDRREFRQLSDENLSVGEPAAGDWALGYEYEQTQSRIGDTLWNAPMRYIENSPIFMGDRVKTPLLMLHNDQDGAVPWYQGIEYFLALRRLGKECYLLNYNGEDHGLRKKQNQLDYTVRMFQFFEHHLEGKQAPGWMKNGVPFVDRDKEKESIRGLLAPLKK